MQPLREWTYSALAGGIILLGLILVSFFPILFLLLFLLPLPFVLTSAKYGSMAAITTLVVSSMGWFIFTGDTNMWYVLLYAAVVGGLLGRGYRLHKSAWFAIVAGGLGSIGTLLAFIVFSFVFLQINWIASFETAIYESIQLNQGWLQEATGMQVDPEELGQTYARWGQMVPFLLVALTGMIVSVNHFTATRWLKRSGGPAPMLPPVQDWQIPRSVVYYYIFSFIVSLFVDIDKTNIWTLFVLNILPLLTFVLAIQGLSFIFYWADKKLKGKWIPRISVVLLFVFPPVAYIYNLIGILDLGFPLRKMIRG